MKKKIKIHINLPVIEGAYGGSYRFLGALRKYFTSMGVYVEDPAQADVILFSASQYIPQTIKLKRKYPNKIFVHRIDGPIRLYHKLSDKRDLLVHYANKYIADGTVFQSEWSKAKNRQMGLQGSKFEAVIMNAPDQDLFFKKETNKHNPVRLVASSWSSYKKKGFPTYEFLDKNLDTSKYSFTFIGNSPVAFTNTESIPPLAPEELANKLRDYDIYITASENDPCSNSLIEALHSGLPCIVLNSGGHPEIIGKAGEVFSTHNELLDAVETVSLSYDSYAGAINVPVMETVSKDYYDFCSTVYQKLSQSEATNKELTEAQRFHLFAIMVLWFLSRNWDKILKQYEKVTHK